jgi:hypothetical protein
LTQQSGELSLRILVLNMAAEWLMALVLFVQFSGNPAERRGLAAGRAGPAVDLFYKFGVGV